MRQMVKAGDFSVNTIDNRNSPVSIPIPALGRAIAVDTSLGHSHLDPSHTFEPAKVIYLDFENGEDWWVDGLEAMNAPLDLPICQ